MKEGGFRRFSVPDALKRCQRDDKAKKNPEGFSFRLSQRFAVAAAARNMYRSSRCRYYSEVMLPTGVILRQREPVVLATCNMD